MAGERSKIARSKMLTARPYIQVIGDEEEGERISKTQELEGYLNGGYQYSSRATQVYYSKICMVFTFLFYHSYALIHVLKWCSADISMLPNIDHLHLSPPPHLFNYFKTSHSSNFYIYYNSLQCTIFI